MKKKTHPVYQDVLFVDSSTGFKFVCGSTLQPKEKEKFEGKEYPIYKLSVSSASHPFFTKSNEFIDTEGRIEKFANKYAQKRKQELAAKEVEKKAAVEKKTKAKKTTKKAVKKK
ncbi:MAG: 50S ribosomal protein L31 type B [Candidatus Anoxychlamydiales bacterium]|nr:50S ribosomal protein L31 type B [Candidatus Anoxychlamydiales bacterium]